MEKQANVFNMYSYIREFKKGVSDHLAKGGTLGANGDRLDQPTMKLIRAMHGKTEVELVKLYNKETVESVIENHMQKYDVVFRGKSKPVVKTNVKKAANTYVKKVSKEFKDSNVPKNLPFADLLKDYKVKK